MENRYKINYDMKTRSVNNIKFMQGDIESSVLEISLTDSGLPVIITGEVIEFRFLKADETIVFQDVTTGVSIMDALTGKMQCILKSDTLSVPGVVQCEIYRTLNGKGLTTQSFNFTVEASIGAEGALSVNYISSIETKLLELDVAKGELDTIIGEYDLALQSNTDIEIVNARTGEVNLGTKIEKMDLSSASNTQQLTEFEYGTNNPREFLISIIDDDGTEAFLTYLKPLLVARGLKCDLAVNIGYVDDGVTLGKMTAAQLVQLELEGFGVLNHGWEHIPPSSLTIAETEANSILEKDKFNTLGLTNSHDYYVIPTVMDLGDLTTKNKMKKHYKCNFANTNASANSIPFDSMEIRRENLLVNEAGLPAAKRYIDECFIKKQYCAFLIHSADITDTTYIAQLLDYIVSEGYAITPAKTVIDNYKNIIELGNKSSQHFIVDQNGNMDFSPNAQTLKVVNVIDMDYTLPITAYDKDCVTQTLVGYESPRALLPDVQPGILTTHRLSWLKYSDDRYAYQLFRVFDEAVVYIRIWLYATNVWGEWQYYNKENNPASIFDNTVQTDMTNYKMNCVTHQSVVAGAVAGMPNTGSGTLDTYKYNIEKYTRQEFQQFDTNDKWVRKWIATSSSWTVWSKYTIV